MKKVNLGIVGLGFQGKVHLRNSLHLKGVNVVGVADVSEKALNYARKMGMKKVYKNYEELLKDDRLDAVVISLPNFLHLESVVKAAEAEKDIFLEKPLARNVEEGEKIVSCVKKSNVKLMVGYDLRFHHVIREIYKKLNNGFFGQVQIAEATNVSGGPFSLRSDRVGPVPVSSWWFNKELVGGGALLDLGSHMIDLLTWFFGEVDYIKCYFGYVFNLDLEDAATCVLKFKNGPLATVKVGWFSKDYMQSIQICGTAKSLTANLSQHGVWTRVWSDIKKKIGLCGCDPYYLELKYFVNCLRNDENPVPSAEDGLTTLRIISQAYESKKAN
ncbi:MAG: Gfo/Idh/MocA family oxidoreductase [Candidatus Aenigmatarchaeota archaeon]